MVTEQYWFIFLNAALINNFVLASFLGICPFLGVSGKVETASRMGAAVAFVMIIASIAAYGIHHLLVMIDAQFLQLILYSQCHRQVLKILLEKHVMRSHGNYYKKQHFGEFKDIALKISAWDDAYGSENITKFPFGPEHNIVGG